MKQRITLTTFRCSAHNLAIETGRHHNIPRNERRCNSNSTENEYHFVLTCAVLRAHRVEYLPKRITSFTNKFKLIRLIQTTNSQILGKILSKCMEKRNEILDSLNYV